MPARPAVISVASGVLPTAPATILILSRRLGDRDKTPKAPPFGTCLHALEVIKRRGVIINNFIVSHS